MHIAILDLCTPHSGFDAFGATTDVLRDWIAPHMPEATFTPLSICTGAPLPTPMAFDGYLLSGSEKGVYDDVEWMEPLKTFLQEVRDLRIPVFGICFGHQIMAEAYGGHVEKAGLGMIAGVRTFEDASGPFQAHVIHQDQVIDVPPSATVIATADYCPNAALRYDFPAQSVQFHPEYDVPYMEFTIGYYEGNGVSSEQSHLNRLALAAGPASPDLFGPEAAAMYRAAHAERFAGALLCA